jgi:creatinine amidohydrolase
MGWFSSALTREVRLERMRPTEIAAAKADNPTIYVAFGSIEWHGYHNPVGLDAIKAHEQLVGLALRIGGVVYPAVFFGAGGGHVTWPSSFMVDAEPMITLVTQLLWGFERDGYQKTVLLSGHYPNRSEYLDAGRQAYLSAGGQMQVLSIIENEVPGCQGDHGAKVETSAMLYLHPDTVDLSELERGNSKTLGGPQEEINWMGEAYRTHPCYGLVGVDPRAYASAAFGEVQTEALFAFLEAWVERDA